MKPPAEAVARRRDLANLLARTVLAAQLLAVPADFLTWAAALKATEYQAWRLKSGEITAILTGRVDDRPIRVTTVFKTVPPFMRDIADQLPAFESRHPAGRYPLPEAA